MYIRRKLTIRNKIDLKFSVVELNKIVLKSLLSSSDFNFLIRIYIFSLLQKYSSYSSFSYFRRICSISGYTKSVFRLFQMSRHNSKKYASLGLLQGMRKSSF